jgi:hypothetical protein
MQSQSGTVNRLQHLLQRLIDERFFKQRSSSTAEPAYWKMRQTCLISQKSKHVS